MSGSRRLSSGSLSQRLSPRVLGAAFATVLSDVPSDRLADAVRACTRYLERAGLLHRAPAVLRALDEELLFRQKLLRADVVSAEPFTDDEAEEVEGHLTRVVGHPVRARVTVRTALLAGFRAEAGGVLVDASLRGSLARLRTRLRGRAARALETHA